MGSTLQVFDAPSHPYTQALLHCLPSVELQRQQLVEIGGQPPDLAHLPPGCPFAPRCPQRRSICEEAYPPPVAVAQGHVAHCWAADARSASVGSSAKPQHAGPQPIRGARSTAHNGRMDTEDYRRTSYEIWEAMAPGWERWRAML